MRVTIRTRRAKKERITLGILAATAVMAGQEWVEAGLAGEWVDLGWVAQEWAVMAAKVGRRGEAAKITTKPWMPRVLRRK